MHLAGNGTMPTMIGVGVPLVLTFAVGVPLAGAPLSRWRLATAVVAAQALFHLAFALHSGHHADQAQGAHVTPSMLAAHAFAALATYAVLRRADVLVAVIRGATLSLVRRLTVVAPRLATLRTTAPLPPGAPSLLIGIARCTRGLRGPPLFLA